MKFVLSARPPFSLAAVVNSHGWVQLAPFSHDKETDGFDYVLELSSGQTIDLCIRSAGASEVQVGTSVTLTQVEQEDLAGRVTWMLGLDQDLTPFYERARLEPKLAHVAAEGRGRILRSATLFEDAIKTMCTVNTSWTGTKRMVRGLVEDYGATLAGAAARRAFPNAARLAAASEQELRAHAGLGFRAPFVLGLARAAAAGNVDLEALKHSPAPTLEVRKELLAIKGIGDYAAANLLMILGRSDFIPVDSWALKVVSKEWHNGQPIGRPEVEAAFAAWGEWKGLAYWFWNYA